MAITSTHLRSTASSRHTTNSTGLDTRELNTLMREFTSLPKRAITDALAWVRQGGFRSVEQQLTQSLRGGPGIGPSEARALLSELRKLTQQERHNAFSALTDRGLLALSQAIR